MTRFIVDAPPYMHQSAGITIMHKLCYFLRCAGYEAYITAPSNPEWANPAFDGYLRPDDYVIYPDCIIGNPLKANRVIRYMLYYPWGYFANQRIPNSELCIPYMSFLIPSLNAACDYEISEDYCLEIGTIEPNLFNINPNIEKTIDSYWQSHKGEGNFNAFNLPKHCQKITYEMPRQEVALQLQKTRNFYCFDATSMMMHEAFLCGCNCFLITSDREPRCVQWWGRSKEYNEFIYSDITRMHSFVRQVKDFFA